ncbi:cellulase [Spongiibacter sp. KMU-158]|uniref:cellulase n=1 Tax=Spongiibacter pelagi TaxID=2760804 RepID=A0A927C016_9GAMM|nr:cellulose synthase complex periplasmic endoglucanase BcsZ [Spongiibacter pelagi]MBD2857678.1 cellulase [Spongiibacter pelagi]
MSRLIAFIGLMLTITTIQAADCDWPQWQQFAEDYIAQGRVIDGSDSRQITTSEGQAYALFFALVANDQARFKTLLKWTEQHLFDGDMTATLPAWLWGKSEQNWQVLDTNPASDADVWMAYTLLEAGKLWDNARYKTLGYLLANRVSKEESTEIPGFGKQLLPSSHGFVSKQQVYRINPSYLPLQVLDRLANLLPHSAWPEIRDNSAKLLPQLMPMGLMPDWAELAEGKIKLSGTVGSYDAIRTYLWAGMLHSEHPERSTLLAKMQPMLALTKKHTAPPEKTQVISGQASGIGPYGFSAALLPMLTASNKSELAKHQKARVIEGLANSPVHTDYYNRVLSLFALAWPERYQFSQTGELQTDWSKACK